jgi:FMN phosphatase YigB (HAD superfamily)
VIHRLVSYDVWDTVLRRQCHPDAVKIHTANELLHAAGLQIPFHFRDPFVMLRFRQSVERDIGRESAGRGGDDEYALKDVLERWVSVVCEDTPGRLDELVGHLEMSELSFEKSVVFLDESIIEKFRSDRSTRRIYISDFYMPKANVEALLESVGALEFFDRGYVSCDESLNKRSGRLFDHVATVEAGFDEWIHIGDNVHSDVKVPEKKGIQVVLYQPEPQHSRRMSSESLFQSREVHLKEILGLGNQSRVGDSDALVLPLLMGFVLLLQEQVRARRLKKLFFFTREGEFFLQLYEALRVCSPFHAELPRGQLLEVSRLSTFSPSLQAFSLSEMMRVWNLYSTQSIGSLFKTLSFDIVVFDELAARHGIDLSAPIKYPWLDERVINFFNDADVQERAGAEIAAKKAITQAYLNDRMKLDTTDLDVGVVDIGWRGTIQDNIAFMYPGIRFHGFYLGINRYLNAQPSNVEKIAFGPNPNSCVEFSSLLRFVAPIEMICNSRNGSVTGYVWDGKQVSAVRDVDDGENRPFDSFTGPLQARLYSEVARVAPIMMKHAFCSSDLRHLAMAGWQQLIFGPPDDLVAAYFSLDHNETFGLGGYVKKGAVLTRGQLLKLILTKSGRQRARELISAIGWLDGYLRWRGDSMLSKLVKLLYASK